MLHGQTHSYDRKVETALKMAKCHLDKMGTTVKKLAAKKVRVTRRVDKVDWLVKKWPKREKEYSS